MEETKDFRVNFMKIRGDIQAAMESRDLDECLHVLKCCEALCFVLHGLGVGDVLQIPTDLCPPEKTF